MCNLSKGVREEGRAEGLKQGLEEGLEKGLEKGRVEMAVDMILGLMRTTNKSVSEVMDMADVDKAIRPQVEKAVKQSTK